jgi:hypothetical protein
MTSPPHGCAGSASGRFRRVPVFLAAGALALTGCGSSSQPSAVPTSTAATPTPASSPTTTAATPTPSSSPVTSGARPSQSGAGGSTTTSSRSRSPSAKPAPVPLNGTKQIEVAVRLYSDSFRAGDIGTAYHVLSARCRSRISVAELGAQSARSGGFAAVLDVKAKVQGERASVSYTYPRAALNQHAEPWIREGGNWTRDRC